MQEETVNWKKRRILSEPHKVYLWCIHFRWISKGRTSPLLAGLGHRALARRAPTRKGQEGEASRDKARAKQQICITEEQKGRFPLHHVTYM